jgi:hypothetical protein
MVYPYYIYVFNYKLKSLVCDGNCSTVPQMREFSHHILPSCLGHEPCPGSRGRQHTEDVGRRVRAQLEYGAGCVLFGVGTESARPASLQDHRFTGRCPKLWAFPLAPCSLSLDPGH